MKKGTAPEARTCLQAVSRFPGPAASFPPPPVSSASRGLSPVWPHPHQHEKVKQRQVSDRSTTNKLGDNASQRCTQEAYPCLPKTQSRVLVSITRLANTQSRARVALNTPGIWAPGTRKYRGTGYPGYPLFHAGNPEEGNE